MSSAKVLMILFDVVLVRISASPPNPVLPIHAHIIPDWRERFLKSLAYPSMAFRALYWTASCAEIMVIMANTFSHAPLSTIVLRVLLLSPNSISSIRITSLFLAGNVLTFVGTILRVICYRTLGSLFTFELSIMKNHSLVVTGPYAYVRHPSYSGLILTILGGYLSHLSAGSWARESGVLQTELGKGLAFLFVTIGLAVIMSLLLRMPREDEMLKRRFGKEWDEWAQMVPYKIIPFIH